MTRPQRCRGRLLSLPLLLLATVFLLLALLHPTQAATYSRNPLARAVHKTGKAMQRRVQAAKGNKHQQQRKDEDEDEDLVTSMQVDVEEATTGPRGGGGRRNRHRIVRQLQHQQTDAEETNEGEEGEKDSGATPAAPVPEPMKITLDMNIKDVGGGGKGGIATAALEEEAPADVPASEQHRALILGVALGGGLLLLTLVFVFIRKAYLRREEEQQQQQQRHLAGAGGVTLEASPKKKRPGEFNSVTGAGGVGGPNSPTAGGGGVGERSLSGRLAGERAGGNNNSKNKIMVREESRIESTRGGPNTGRGDFFQLKEIDLGVQSPGRGGPGSKVFSPRG